MANKLETAMELYFQWQTTEPQPAAAAFLAAHAEYADYLEPLLTGGESGQPDGPDDPQTPDEPAPRLLGEYRLGRELGRGGMGIVYEAWQPSLDRHIALKVLSPQLTHDPATLIRFRREATTAAALQHPGIAQVLEFGNVGETHFLAMQLVRGASLEEILRQLNPDGLAQVDGRQILETIRQARPATRAGLGDTDASDSRPASGTAEAAMTWSGGYVQTVTRLIIQVAETLEFAHNAGVIHRDVKPSNILVRADGRAVLADFGLARAEGISSLSMTGDFAGSPYYVSPEQGARKSSELDRRTDLFSLGVTLYEVLTLHRPFTGDTPHQVIDSILRDEPPSPERWNPDLPGDLVAIILKSIEKDPQRRYQTAAGFAADLRAFLEYRPVTARFPTTWTRIGRWARREPLKLSLAAFITMAAVLSSYVWLSQDATRTGQAELLRRAVDGEVIEGWFANQNHELAATAAAHFENALRLDPGNPRALFGRMWCEVLFGDSAVKFLDREARPGRDEAAIARMRSFFGALEIGKDRRPVRRRIEIGELAGMGALECFALGVFYLPEVGGAHSREHFELCLRLFLGAIYNASEPRFEHYLMLAYVASRTDDRLQARLCADALLTHWPEEPLALAVAGVALAYTDRPRARQLLEAAIERRPNLFYARVNLALALSADGEMEGALEHARAAERSIPDNSQIHGILGMLLTKQAMLLGLPESDPKRRDLLERAVVHGRKRLADKPRDQVALLQVGSALERLGRVDEAWELALEIVRVAPTYTKGHKGVIGLARVRADIPAQRAEYLRWVDVNPNGPTAHRELAEFLLEHGAGKADLDLALRTIKRADQLMQGRDPFILVTLAEVLQRRGETMSIPRVLQRAEQFLPQDEESRGGLVGRIAALRAR